MNLDITVLALDGDLLCVLTAVDLCPDRISFTNKGVPRLEVINACIDESFLCWLHHLLHTWLRCDPSNVGWLRLFPITRISGLSYDAEKARAVNRLIALIFYSVVVVSLLINVNRVRVLEFVLVWLWTLSLQFFRGNFQRILADSLTSFLGEARVWVHDSHLFFAIWSGVIFEWTHTSI